MNGRTIRLFIWISPNGFIGSMKWQKMRPGLVFAPMKMAEFCRWKLQNCLKYWLENEKPNGINQIRI